MDLIKSCADVYTLEPIDEEKILSGEEVLLAICDGHEHGGTQLLASVSMEVWNSDDEGLDLKRYIKHHVIRSRPYARTHRPVEPLESEVLSGLQYFKYIDEDVAHLPRYYVNDSLTNFTLDRAIHSCS